jgi:hypothetical protein
MYSWLKWTREASIRFPKMSKYIEEQKYWFPNGPLEKEPLAFDVIPGKASQVMKWDFLCCG